MSEAWKFIVDQQSFDMGEVPKYDFHMHTNWTDGANTTREMYEAAATYGLKAILFSEHARSSSGDWFGKFAQEVRSLPSDPLNAFVGVETKVNDFDGNLDTTDEILSHCDLIMASVHRFPGEKGVVRGFGDVDPGEAAELEFKLATAILRNSPAHILAHPFGMCYRRYNVVPPEEMVDELIKIAASSGKAFEINCHYHPDPWLWIQKCRKVGALFSLGSNAHAVKNVGDIHRALTEDKST